MSRGAKRSLRSRTICLGVTVIVLASYGAAALEVVHADAHYQDKEYRVELDLIVDAPSERVEAVLRDYARYPRLDPSILEAHVQSRPDAHSVLLYTKLRACAGVFCRTVNRVERVREGDLELEAIVLPDRSDVIDGRTHTTLVADAGKTRVHYQTFVVPKFWVPGLIGRPLMLRTLKDASLNLFKNVEIYARASS